MRMLYRRIVANNFSRARQADMDIYALIKLPREVAQDETALVGLDIAPSLRPWPSLHGIVSRSGYSAGHYLSPTATPLGTTVGHVTLHGDPGPHDEFLSQDEHDG